MTSRYSEIVKPSIKKVVEATEAIERSNLKKAEQATDKEIDDMFDEAKEENKNLLNEAKQKMKDAKPNTESEYPAFNKWLEKDAKPMVTGTTKLLANVLNIFMSAVVAIRNMVVRPVRAVTKFFVDRAGCVMNFFKTYF
eukprot:GFUD01007635.1.p1 GENE.GFUD01007635.1~~GFUD01007635.1.p1  ORF type:complete len:139 (+),score=27.42 GFUD01007635.1:39-455(+)